METKEYLIEVGGKTITAQFSNLADQANGSVILKCEDTVVLATAVMSKEGKGNPGFFNLTVDYLEKFYAAGLILGGQFNKREGKPSDEAILSSRIIDRTIRPLFDQHIKNAVQVIVTVLSVGKIDPGVLAVNAASLAIGVSDIPWNGPVGAVHIGKVKGETALSYDKYIPNTGEGSYDLDLTICGRDGKVCMIEALTFEESEEKLGEAFDFAMKHITELESWQKKIISEIGKTKQNIPKPITPDEIKTSFTEKIGNGLSEKIFNVDGKKNIHELDHAWKEFLLEKYPLDEAMRNVGEDYFESEVDRLVHDGATKNNARADGRKMDQVRKLFAQAGKISEMLHGSGIFYRGETHVLSTLTLGGPADAYMLDGMEVRGSKRFMHHYNFPPYSSGETGRVGGMNRREMGHGMLAEKALVPVIPDKTKFPYTIRLVSESMASNGSTSQASICASTIALLDGGVPIKAPVAGIAMGLMIDENGKDYKILTDIQGPEDHYGDMDFKVAGTRTGITALQLDIKVDGVKPEILKEALVNAKTARMEILDVIEKEIPAPRADISKNAPKILVIKIKVDQIGLVIGGGGKTVNAIRDKTGAEINIEDDGTVYVTGKNGSAEAAIKIIEALTHEWKPGEQVEGTVEKILEIGAVVKISEQADGLVHISEIAPFRINRVADVLHEGMKVPVKVINVDQERGRISLSIKEADKDFIKNPYPPRENPKPAETSNK